MICIKTAHLYISSFMTSIFLTDNKTSNIDIQGKK